MHSSLSQIRPPVVLTPRPAKALSDIDNATAGSILSFKKLFLRGFPSSTGLKLNPRARMSIRALKTKWRIINIEGTAAGQILRTR